MKGTPGVYILVVSLTQAQTIKVGKRRVITFAPGHYFYVGSALNGLEARINRHLAREKRRHWHIDYLLEAGQVVGVLTIPSLQKIECLVAEKLSDGLEMIAGFGSTDCNCPSHLFFHAGEDWISHVARKLSRVQQDNGFAAQVYMPSFPASVIPTCRDHAE